MLSRCLKPITFMPNQKWEEIEGIFNQAVLLPEEQVASYLQEKCGANRELLVELETLLIADRKYSQLIEDSVSGLAICLLAEDFTKRSKGF
jgi:hypothetical protein